MLFCALVVWNETCSRRRRRRKGGGLVSSIQPRNGPQKEEGGKEREGEGVTAEEKNLISLRRTTP